MAFTLRIARDTWYSTWCFYFDFDFTNVFHDILYGRCKSNQDVRLPNQDVRLMHGHENTNSYISFIMFLNRGADLLVFVWEIHLKEAPKGTLVSHTISLFDITTFSRDTLNILQLGWFKHVQASKTLELMRYLWYTIETAWLVLFYEVSHLCHLYFISKSHEGVGELMDRWDFQESGTSSYAIKIVRTQTYHSTLQYICFF